MSSVPFDALSANSPFAALREFVKAHGLNRGGVPLKATSKAALYAQIVECCGQATTRTVPDSVPSGTEPPPPEAKVACGSEPPPASTVEHARTPSEPFVIMVDSLFPDRFDALKAQYPFFNGLGTELIFARVNRYISDHRLEEGTLLYVGTALDDPERGMLVVQNGQAAPWRYDPAGGQTPAHRAVLAHGAVRDGRWMHSREVESRRRMHVALVHSVRSSPRPTPMPDDTPVPLVPQVSPRRQWQHHPVQLAHADVVLHPPRKQAPRRRWTHDAVAIRNAGVHLPPKPTQASHRVWNLTSSSASFVHHRPQAHRAETAPTGPWR